MFNVKIFDVKICHVRICPKKKPSFFFALFRCFSFFTVKRLWDMDLFPSKASSSVPAALAVGVSSGR